MFECVISKGYGDDFHMSFSMEDIVSNNDEDTLLALINTLYYYGAWTVTGII